MSDSLNTLNILNEEWHILGDLNMNLCENCTLLTENNKDIVKGTNKISSEAKKYLKFCKTFEFKQIIQSPTRVTHSTTSLMDHILTNTNGKIAQCRLINLGLSDHQVMFCTRKTKTEKVGVHKQLLLGHLKGIQLMSMKRLYVK